MPTTTTARDIQRNYRQIFDQVKASGEPTIVLTNNQPDVAIIDINKLEQLHERIKEIELIDALDSIRVYETEKKAGNLKELKSLVDLIDEN